MALTKLQIDNLNNSNVACQNVELGNILNNFDIFLKQASEGTSLPLPNLETSGFPLIMDYRADATSLTEVVGGLVSLISELIDISFIDGGSYEH